MHFHADLHVHSKHSRATSRDLDLEHLAWWAARKGIAVIGTGDCVHPGWLAEIGEKLVADGSGLFRLRPEIEAALWQTLPASCRNPVRFMLCTEISTIYKKGDKTRKIHHLIYAPDFATVDRLAARLARIGNIASDGRPILGLDSRDLLEIALDSGPGCYLVPAHIWTPWFAALGSQSGFDSIAECYGDLADAIFAVETGLSSDPAMNWRISSLDRFRLTSNSDAHSPGKLGREATRFTCEPGYDAIRHALQTGEGYGGTVEFFPEEGKYHLDGHRACQVRLDPRETLAQGGLCPACGRRVTVGVAHRVEMLADRAEPAPPPTAGAVASLVPLPEILAEIAGTGAASKAVSHAYDRATAALGPELAMLEELPIEEVAATAPLLGEALSRLRRGAVIRQAGYDGEYGVIRLFAEGELARARGGDLLFDAPRQSRARKAAEKATAPAPEMVAEPVSEAERIGLDPDQARAAAMPGPLAVIAGPGSGKTRMLTHRLARLAVDGKAASCLAVTFTRRVTQELRARLAGLLPAGATLPSVHSFHALGLRILRGHAELAGLGTDFRVASEQERAAVLGSPRLLSAVSALKRSGEAGTGEAAAAHVALRAAGRAGNWVDLDDLVSLAADLLEAHEPVRAAWRERFVHLCVDEFQDVDAAQYRLLRALAAPDADLCVIGDPDQAIYGFRGADATAFARLAADYPALRTLRLGRNYRSAAGIVAGAAAIVGGAPEPMRPSGHRIGLHAAASDRAEAGFVAATIEALLGGHDMLAAARTEESGPGNSALGFADFAVLYRTDQQAAVLREALDAAGIPFGKSTPAPILRQEAVPRLLAALDTNPDGELPARIAAAAAGLRAEIGPAPLAEAARWLTALAETAGDAARLHEAAALATEADFRDPRAARVSLLTMHAAKGLEFAVVFVLGLEEGLMPLAWGDAVDEAEERRLLYVAMTRARDRLYLTRAAQRSRRGKLAAALPSRFLRDLPASLTLVIDPRARRPLTQQTQMKLF